MRTLKLYYYKLYYNCYSIEYIVKFSIIRFIGKGEVQGSSPCNSTIFPAKLYLSFAPTLIWGDDFCDALLSQFEI